MIKISCKWNKSDHFNLVLCTGENIQLKVNHIWWRKHLSCLTASRASWCIQVPNNCSTMLYKTTRTLKPEQSLHFYDKSIVYHTWSIYNPNILILYQYTILQTAFFMLLEKSFQDFTCGGHLTHLKQRWWWSMQIAF